MHHIKIRQIKCGRLRMLEYRRHTYGGIISKHDNTNVNENNIIIGITKEIVYRVYIGHIIGCLWCNIWARELLHYGTIWRKREKGENGNVLYFFKERRRLHVKKRVLVHLNIHVSSHQQVSRRRPSWSSMLLLLYSCRDVGGLSLSLSLSLFRNEHETHTHTARDKKAATHRERIWEL